MTGLTWEQLIPYMIGAGMVTRFIVRMVAGVYEIFREILRAV